MLKLHIYTSSRTRPDDKAKKIRVYFIFWRMALARDFFFFKVGNHISKSFSEKKHARVYIYIYTHCF